MTRGGRVEARQDNGLRPCPEENSALQVLCPSLSPRCRVRRSVSGRTLLLSRNSSSICSRWAALSSHRSFVCERRRLQSTKSHSLSAMLRRYLYWTDIDIMILTIYKISWRIVKYVFKVSGVFPKGRKRDNKRSSVSLFFRLSAQCPVWDFVIYKKHCVQKHGTHIEGSIPPKNMEIFSRTSAWHIFSALLLLLIVDCEQLWPWARLTHNLWSNFFGPGFAHSCLVPRVLVVVQFCN